MDIDPKEFLQLLLELEDFHAVFYQMWNIGTPSFTEEINTAAVEFDRTGECINFKFNPKYWEKLDDYQRKFVICHECLHILLNHGVRVINTPRINLPAANQCLDVAVNHMLVKSFGFDRKKLGSLSIDGCWVDTVFPGKEIDDNSHFEYYFDQLPKVFVPKALMDEHSFLSEEDHNRIVDKVGESLSDKEKSDVVGKIGSDVESSSKKAGIGALGEWYSINIGKVKKKKKWGTVIKKWSRRYDRPDLRDVEQWARLNRRFVTIQSGLLLPTEMEMEYEVEGKIDVFFFQDTSGSCRGLKERFFRAAKSLPNDRFNVRLFCFDTKVYEVDINSNRVRGGGGTSFSIIESKIQDLIKKEDIKYPKAVFIVTDGYGDSVSPQYPKLWYWFLTANNRFYIPKKSNIFMLQDYE